MTEHISIIIPVYNEEGTVAELHRQITAVCAAEQYDYEVIFVDDGSTDATYEVIRGLARSDARARCIRFTRNFGQTAALAAGFEHAGKGLLITLDADLQNDPADIPALVKKLRDGFDVVSGWRKDRRDPFLRKALSAAANAVISRVIGVRLNDYGCTLKIYKKFFIDRVDLYGEMHRFLPAYLGLLGAKIAEIPVHHRPRTIGASKYGMERAFKVFLDLLTAKLFFSYLTKPIYLFGGMGLSLSAVAAGIAALVLYQKYFLGIWAHKNPLLLLSIFIALIGIQFIALGLLAEIAVRSYLKARGQKPYVILE